MWNNVLINFRTTSLPRPLYLGLNFRWAALPLPEFVLLRKSPEPNTMIFKFSISETENFDFAQLIIETN